MAKSRYATYAHTWGWTRLLEENFRLKTIRIGWDDGGGLRGAYPGFIVDRPFSAKGLRRLPIRKRIIFSPYDETWDYGGPCGDDGLTAAQYQRLVRGMEIQGIQVGAVELRISPRDERIGALLERLGYRRRPRLTGVVDLAAGPSRVWQRLDKTFRADIRKAEEAGYESDASRSIDHLESFFVGLRDLQHRKSLKLPGQAFFQLMGSRLRGDLVNFYAVRGPNGPCGGAVVLTFRDTITTRYWAVRREDQKVGANHLLVWRILEDAAKAGLCMCDLGGLPSDPTDGVYRFKMKLKPTPLAVDWFVRSIGPARLARAVAETVRRKGSQSPVAKKRI